MSQINPFIGSVVQASGVQRAQATEKDRQLRRSADVLKNSGLTKDQFEHAVESAEALDPAHDEHKDHPQKKRQSKKQTKKPEAEDQEPRLDLTA